jgi:hypothetical protein
VTLDRFAAGDIDDGVRVDDPRYGRVLIPWDLFERAEFGPGGVARPTPTSRLDGRWRAVVPSGRTSDGRVLLHDGTELQVEDSGDLGEQNAGVLIFAPGRERPEHVSWAEIERVDLSAHDRSGLASDSAGRCDSRPCGPP